MFPCKECNKSFTQKYQYVRHCNTNIHKKRSKFCGVEDIAKSKICGVEGIVKCEEIENTSPCIHFATPSRAAPQNYELPNIDISQGSPEQSDFTPPPAPQKIKIRRRKWLSNDLLEILRSPKDVVKSKFCGDAQHRSKMPPLTTTTDVTNITHTMVPTQTIDFTASSIPQNFETTPSVSFDAIINLFRFTREHYINLPEKGIIKTCVELLTEKLKKISLRPFIFDTDSKSFSIYYRGKWVIENVDYIINNIQTRNDDCSQETPVLCELIDMFIENMMLQFRRNAELHNYHSISSEIEKGYRSNIQIKIVKKLTKIDAFDISGIFI